MTTATSESLRIHELEAENSLLRQQLANQAELKASVAAHADRFTQLTDALSGWYWEQDQQFRFTHIVGDALALIRLPEGVVGKRRWEAPGVDSRDPIWEQHRQLLLSHQAFCDFEYAQMIAGERRWICVSGSPVFNSEGQFTGYHGTAQDVTARKKVQSQLNDSLHLLHRIVDSLPSAITIKAIHDGYRYVVWNKAAQALYGIAAEEALGSTLAALWPAGDARMLHASDLDLVATGDEQEFVGLKIHNRCGQSVSVHMRKVLILDSGGLPSHVLAVTDDITERLAAEQRLRESEEQFRALTVLSADWYWEQDAQFRFTPTAGGIALRNLSPPFNVGKARWEIDGLLISDPEVWHQHKRQLEAHETFHDFEYQRYRDDGQLASICISGEPRFDRKGAFIGYRGVGRDVTARREVEATLRISQERFKTVVAALLEGVVIFDKKGHLIDCNTSAEAILGYPLGVLQGHQSLFPDDNACREDGSELPPTEYPPLPLAADSSSRVLGIRRPDGIQWVVANVTPLLMESSESPTGWVTTLVDITALELSKQQIRQLNVDLENRVLVRTAELEQANRKLEASNRELEAFSYSIAHDIRSPLSSIDGFSALLEKAITQGTGITDTSLHQLSRIRRGVKQMGEMTDGLLSLAQLSRSAVMDDLLNLSSMASTVLGQLQERDAERAATLYVQPDVVARGDGALMRQVLENLLANAWKFTSKEPHTFISFRECVSPSGEPIYVVQDNGVGFDMAYADKLFGTFQRLHSPGEFDGTGIGLATVRKIISRHGGEIWASSEPRQGSRFYFTLATKVQPVDS